MGISSGGLQSNGSAALRLAAGATGSSLTLTPPGAIFVGWIGDSISLPSTTNAPAQYGSATRLVSNWAVSGARWTSGTQPIAAQYTANTTNQTRLVGEGGVNDVRADATGLSIFTTAIAWVDARLAEGKQVVMNNIGPWKTGGLWTAPRQAEADDYNARLLAATGTRPGMKVIDLFTLLEGPAGSQTLAPAYDSGDGLHPNTAAGAVWAAAIAAVSP